MATTEQEHCLIRCMQWTNSPLTRTICETIGESVGLLMMGVYRQRILRCCRRRCR
ncbi:hypothetical protein [Moraxella lacunata]|uniref:hypothetical protein n=1 Tax=Moraxella lacunata TaxID=477 RepID=UPI003EDF9669